MKSPKECTHTKGGIPFRFYADDAGGDFPIHGAIYDCIIRKWFVDAWAMDGGNITDPDRDLDLTDWRDKIPWECIRPEVKYIARDATTKIAWYGYEYKPHLRERTWTTSEGDIYDLSGLNMPEGPEYWTQSLARRPIKENE